MPKVEIYTDGSCNNRRTPPKFGGFSVVLDEKIAIIGGEGNTTSARMELLAVTVCIEHFSKEPNTELHVFSDCEYISKAFNSEWIYDWMRIDFATTKNKDLWKRIIKALKSDNILTFKISHVKGHSGIRLNELADKLADRASQKMEKLVKEQCQRFTEYVSIH